MIKNVILDTKVFVLLIVGLIDEKYIGSFFRTKEFSIDNYRLLKQKIGSFEKIFVTPHGVTEFSHLTIEENSFKDDYKKIVKKFILELTKGNLEEKNIKLSAIFSNNKIFYLGATDVSLMELCEKNSVVITSDGRLADKLMAAGQNVLKFIPTQGFVNY
jgi:hypothetical protein